MNNYPGNERIKELAEKWLKGHISPEEMEEYNEWYNEMSGEEIKIDPSFAKTESELKERILKRIYNHSPAVKDNTGKKKYLWMSAAAIVALLSIAGIYLWRWNGKRQNMYPEAVVKDPAYKNDVYPGTNKAVLTLGNGKRIILDSATNGVLAIQNGMKIMKNKDGQLICKADSNATHVQPSVNTVTTPAGAIYQVILPDGSHVWLNDASSITYPTQFTGNNRKVNITGEAYFEVAKNPSRPFIVSASGMNVTVLGTHFDVSAYKDESSIKTTLLEGSVKISGAANINALLVPGQQSRLSRNGTLKVENVDVSEAVAWKDGDFQFNQTDISALMRQVARWYNVNVFYEGEKTSDLFTGTIPRNLTLTQLLAILKYARVHFKLEENNLTVLP